MSLKNINDIELYYEIHGAGQPLLFIHGLGTSSKDWEYQLNFFISHYQVITVDLRGHGQTTKAQGTYSIKLFADDIAKLLKKLNITNIHIVGLSLGGMISFQLARDNPELVKSMVIVNSWSHFPINNLKTRLKFYARLLMIQFMSMKKVGEAIASSLFPEKKQRKLRELFVERFKKNDKSSYTKSLKSIVIWDFTKELYKIKCPSLIVTADHDYSSIQSKKDYIKLMPNAQLQIIENSHHGVTIEKPEEFNQILSKFLKNNE
ncbi:MAG: alpha/beta hydrolase [Methylococcales bacterium]|nr:alpha/beta hydrolase [Methylococcales bacterium]